MKGFPGRLKVLIDGGAGQILVTREQQTRGFILFVYNNTLGDHHLPTLHKGLTSDLEGGWFLAY